MRYRTRRPRVILNCVADRYTGGSERIIEFADSRGNGGLISLTEKEDGSLWVDLYNYGPQVQIPVGKAAEVVSHVA